LHLANLPMQRLSWRAGQRERTDGMSKYTPWFPANIPPAREGQYQRRIPLSSQMAGTPIGPAYFKAGAWLVNWTTGDKPSLWQDCEWRGLRKPAHGVLPSVNQQEK
jgi:hypothetical protein